MWNGELLVATEKETKLNWSGAKNGLKFRCGLCGHRFVVGDRWRGVMANTGRNPEVRHGNFLVCGSCHDLHDGNDEKLLAIRAQQEQEARRRFWWLMDTEHLEWIDRERPAL